MTGLLYKYLSPSIGIEHVLKGRTLRFTPPNELNDPFECVPYLHGGDIDRILGDCSDLAKIVEGIGLDPQLAARLIKVKAKSKVMEASMGEMAGILSLTKREDSLLMWSHYADQHRGIVIGVRAGHTFFQPGNGIGIDGLKGVTYTSARPEIELGKPLDMPNVNDALFFTKSPEWSYEEEIRVIRDGRLAGDLTNTRGITSFPPDLISEIIIGAKTSLQDLGRVYNVHASTYRHARLLLAGIDDREYGITLDEAPPMQFANLIFSIPWSPKPA